MTNHEEIGALINRPDFQEFKDNVFQTFGVVVKVPSSQNTPKIQIFGPQSKSEAAIAAIDALLQQGAERARGIAQATMRRVRDRVGIGAT